MSVDKRLQELRLEDERPDVELALSRVRHIARLSRMLRRAAVAALTAAVVGAAILVPRVLGREEPSDIVTPPPEPAPSISYHPAKSTGRARLIANVYEQDLWLYDVQADRIRRLTADGDHGVENNVQFYGTDYILYNTNEPAKIHAIPIGGGRPQTIVEDKGVIFDFDVSPDGSSIAYIQEDSHGTGTLHRLKLADLSGDPPSVLRELGSPGGRGVGSEDEVSVEWSPDGRMILVTDTYTDLEQTDWIHVLDGGGKRIVPSWTGTHARWSPDGRTILYRGYAGANGKGWHTFDVATKRRTNLKIRAGTNNLSFSPDGARVVYDTSRFGDYSPEALVSKNAPTVYVYDLRRRVENLVKEAAVFALWTSPSELLVTEGRRARPADRTLNSWVPLGSVTHVRLPDGKERQPSIRSTAWDTAVLYDG